MTPDAVALASMVLLIFSMGFFLLSSPAFLLVRLDIPEVTQLLRGLFRSYFLMVAIAGVIATTAFALAGRLVFTIGVGLIAAFAIWARGWFLRRMDSQMSARDAGDAEAVRRLRRMHWGGMLSNALQLAVVLGSIPYVMST